MILNASSLIRNRHKDKYFGIDYYANICHGSNAVFNYLSTPLDFYPLSNHKPPTPSLDREQDLLKRIKQFDGPKIIGFFDNPEIYQCHDSIAHIIDEFQNTKHGLFIQTTSLNILKDIDRLVTFSQTNPLLIGLPISSLKGIDLSIYDSHQPFKQVEKIAKALHKSNLKFGFVIKPVIPFVNDDLDDFKALLKTLVGLNPNFIYPTFSITFDSKKLNNFYHMIDHEHSELKPLFFDQFGYKKSWMSLNAGLLKKAFIFNIKKTHIAYSMRQIIELYKLKTKDEQISLF